MENARTFMRAAKLQYNDTDQLNQIKEPNIWT